ncbi:MAG TPA: hypothetical protein IAC12_07245 [Candidatus Aphodovivens avistercoris]|nr:hypothetical protein [Candidatus Aphodovivens avistercoris]
MLLEKRLALAACGACLALTLAACSTSATGGSTEGAGAGGASAGAAQTEEASSGQLASTAGTPEEMIAVIEGDFSATSEKLQTELDAAFASLGDTYDGYVANSDALLSWYDLSLSETESLMARTIENGRSYYRMIVSTYGAEDYDALDDAMDDFYDVVYDDAFSDYYDTVYEDQFELVYDTYYDSVLKDAYDTVPYSDWYDVRSDCYDDWYDYRLDIYDAWYDGKSDVYDEWYDVNSAFYNREYDIDEILRLDKE